MQQFSTQPERFNELRKTLLLRSLPIALLAAGVGTFMGQTNADIGSQDDPLLFIFIPFMLALVAYGLYRGVAIQKKLFNSYRLTFDQDYVTRERLNTPTITVPYTKITSISKNYNNSFTIKSDSVHNVIGIPAQMADYDQLEQLLSTISPLTVETREPFLQWFSWAISLVTIGLMATVYLASNKVLVGISGTLTLVLMVYSLLIIQRNKNIDNKTKRGSWWVIFLIFSLLAIMYTKLFIVR